MPDIVKTAEAPDIPPHVRDGYIMMFIYLPGTFGDKFTPYVGNVIPAILKVIQIRRGITTDLKSFVDIQNDTLVVISEALT